jgi:hypothetical protein
LALILSVAVGLVSATGCGGKSTATTQTAVTTQPGTYTLTITGTAGATMHSTAWTVIVQ